MMYFDYPEVTERDRLAHAQPIDPTQVKLSPEEAWAQLKTPGAPDEVIVETFDGRAAYWFRIGGLQKIVYADNGQVREKPTPERNLRTAAEWARQPVGEARVDAKAPGRSVDRRRRLPQLFAVDEILMAERRGGLCFGCQGPGRAIHNAHVTRGRMAGTDSPLAVLHAFAEERPALEQDRHLAIRRGNRCRATGLDCGALDVLSVEALPFRRRAHKHSLCGTKAAAHDPRTVLWFSCLHLGFQRDALDGSVSAANHRRLRRLLDDRGSAERRAVRFRALRSETSAWKHLRRRPGG